MQDMGALLVWQAVELTGPPPGYERTEPVFNYTVDECGPVHLVVSALPVMPCTLVVTALPVVPCCRLSSLSLRLQVGDGGNVEGMASTVIDQAYPPYCNVRFMV